ncbi:hypothetical protein [Streptomyces sp. NPDC002057]|uniref:hypothetical protein n=1 Tax=Streptomyces sp. NPDC002057 TaxID=3154664 RepID=UPI0033339B8F
MLGEDAAVVGYGDTYLRAGAGDPVSLLETSEPFAGTEEVLALLRWMRAFNQSRPD